MLFFTVLCLPFAFTALGAAAVLIPAGPQRMSRSALDGLAAGVMSASAVFSLLLPALELGSTAYEALIGLFIGFLFAHFAAGLADRLSSGRAKGPLLSIITITLHNLPEGMAVGMALAGFLSGAQGLSGAAVLATALGVAIQNLPEGAIVSLPLHAAGKGRLSAFGVGVLSGIVEPIGAALALLFSEFSVAILPYSLAFAAGAMLAVVSGELAESFSDKSSAVGRYAFAVGFLLMTTLDVLLT